MTRGLSVVGLSTPTLTHGGGREFPSRRALGGSGPPPSHPPPSRGRAGWGARLAIGLVLVARPAYAGMPSFTLTDLARLRFEAISFFSLVLLLSAKAIQRIWNGLRADFPGLPWISYKRAVGLVTLWGLLFGLVLTMISGARELLTPGAWRKDGYTYKLNGEEAPKADPLDAERRARLEALRLALWTYAGTHQNQFPADRDDPAIPTDLWKTPDASGMKYVYVPGLAPNKGDAALAIEPQLFGPTRLVLTTSGAIRTMTPGDARETREPGPAAEADR